MSFSSTKGIDKFDYMKALSMSDNLKEHVMHYVVTRDVTYNETGGMAITYRTYRTTSLPLIEGKIIRAFMTDEELRSWERDIGGVAQ